MTADIRRVAVIGADVIGASWSALFLSKGLDVIATDPAPEAGPKLDAFIAAAWPALEQLSLAPGPKTGQSTKYDFSW